MALLVAAPLPDLAAQTQAPTPTGPATTRTETALYYYADAPAEIAAKADDYQRRQCLLDLRYPADRPGFATVIWLHGGGLTGGERGFPPITDPQLAVAAVGYRLSPHAPFPTFLEDAAAATAWVLRNIAARGGDPRKVFVTGHSAGGYLAAMVGMDARWLAPHGFTPRDLAGIVPISAQTTTHFLVKKLRGDQGPEFRPIIDQYAPLYHAAADLPPICLILGDRGIEYKNRVEENQLLASALKNLGHRHVEFYELGGFDHGGVYPPSLLLIPGFVQRAVAAR